MTADRCSHGTIKIECNISNEDGMHFDIIIVEKIREGLGQVLSKIYYTTRDELVKAGVEQK